MAYQSARGKIPHVDNRCKVANTSELGTSLNSNLSLIQMSTEASNSVFNSLPSSPEACVYQSLRGVLGKMSLLLEENHCVANLKFHHRKFPLARGANKTALNVSANRPAGRDEVVGAMLTENQSSKEGEIELLQVEGLGLSQPLKSILLAVKRRLKKSVHYNVSPQPKLSEDDIESTNSDVLPIETFNYLERIVPNMTLEMLKYHCTEEKSRSLEFQMYLKVCPKASLNYLVGLFEKDLFYFLTNAFGNYALQRVLVRDPEFCLALTSCCDKDFDLLARDEFASRAMQKLIEVEPTFRKIVLRRFENRLLEYLDIISAVFLAVVAIRNAKSENEYSFIKKILKQRPEMLSSKNFKRLVACYLEHCSEPELREMADILQVSKRFVSFLNDKFRVIILLIFVQRGYREATDKLLRMVSRQPLYIYQTKFFKFLFVKFVERNNREILGEVHGALLSIRRSQLQRLAQLSSDAQDFFIYTLLSSTVIQTSETEKMLAHFEEWQRPPHSIQFRTKHPRLDYLCGQNS